jgi:multidrug efflux system outer membrane protein
LLLADVASNYFQLIELDRELEVSRQTLVSRRESLRLVRSRESRGVAGGLDVSQAETLVFTASSRIPVLQRQANILENALSILLARNPGGIENRGALLGQTVPSEIPAGLQERFCSGVRICSRLKLSCAPRTRASAWPLRRYSRSSQLQVQLL